MTLAGWILMFEIAGCLGILFVFIGHGLWRGF